MALEGKLSDFNLAEILQLIASQQKSGFLNLEATRDMVFIFDKGKLISTRDRRSLSRDPLESFLKAYGFFTEDQWKHVEFVAKNSSLDLGEILISENLLTEEQLQRVLQGLAQEMTTSGMKLRRGSYHFNATKGSPQGIRIRYSMDVQGLLMEAARRLDEDKLLREILPHPRLRFLQGEKTLPDEALSPTGRHIMSLALAGLPLGQIIRQGKAESFVVRDLLKTWCQEGFLILDDSSGQDENSDGEQKQDRKKFRGPGLRRAPLVLLITLLALGLGWLRWTAPATMDTTAGDALRQRQLHSEVINAVRLYRYKQGIFPPGLKVLVQEGTLNEETLALLEELHWRYERDPKKNGFSLET